MISRTLIVAITATFAMPMLAWKNRVCVGGEQPVADQPWNSATFDIATTTPLPN